VPLAGRQNREDLPRRPRGADARRLAARAPEAGAGPTELPAAVGRRPDAIGGGALVQSARPLSEASRRRAYGRAGLEGGGMSLLTRRVRGFRLFDLVALGVLVLLIVGVYLAKTIAGRERAEI